MSRLISIPARARLPLSVLAIALFVIAIGFGATGLGAAGAATTAGVRNGLIFYDVGSGARGSAIYAVNPDGSGLHRVAGRAWQPSVSPDGRLVAFQDLPDEGLSVMNADGSHRHSIWKLTGPKRPPGPIRQLPPLLPAGPISAEDPSFSPDGTQIVFVDSGRGIWDVNTDGSNLQQLVSLRNGATNPVVSPTGQTIMFTEYNKRSGTDLGLFMMNSDGTNVRAVPNTSRASSGSFSPDGKTIVFQGLHGSSSIYRMSLDGSNLRRLTHPPKHGRGGGPPSFDEMPKFSPDGTQIVFVRAAGNLPDGGWSGPHGLFIVNTDGSHLHRIDGNPDAADPFWQPSL